MNTLKISLSVAHLIRFILFKTSDLFRIFTADGISSEFINKIHHNSVILSQIGILYTGQVFNLSYLRLVIKVFMIMLIIIIDCNLRPCFCRVNRNSYREKTTHSINKCPPFGRTRFKPTKALVPPTSVKSGQYIIANNITIDHKYSY